MCILISRGITKGIETECVTSKIVCGENEMIENNNKAPRREQRREKIQTSRLSGKLTTNRLKTQMCPQSNDF